LHCERSYFQDNGVQVRLFGPRGIVPVRTKRGEL
jgi:hypothetical protein